MPETKASLGEHTDKARRLLQTAEEDFDSGSLEAAKEALGKALSAVHGAEYEVRRRIHERKQQERKQAKAQAKMGDKFVPSEEIRGKKP